MKDEGLMTIMWQCYLWMTPWVNGAKGCRCTHLSSTQSHFFGAQELFSTLFHWKPAYSFHREISFDSPRCSCVCHCSHDGFFSANNKATRALRIIWLWYTRCPAVASASPLLILRRASVCSQQTSKRQRELRSDLSESPHRILHQKFRMEPFQF